MWLRNVLWLPDDADLQAIRGSYMGAVFDADEDGAIDTAGLGVNGLASLLPAEGEKLAQCGSIVLDAVIEGTEDEEQELAEFLALLCPLKSASLLDHAVGKESEVTGVGVYSSGTDEMIHIALRSIQVPEFAFPGVGKREPHLVTRTARILANEKMLLVFWGPRSAVPTLPPPEEIEGEQLYGLDLGSPAPAQREALGVWGSRGAEAFDTMLLRNWQQPLVIAEEWLAMIADDFAEGVKDLETSLKLWELDLQGNLDREGDDHDQFGPLARVGAILGVLEGIRAEIGQSEGNPPYWFARSDGSSELSDALEGASDSLEALRERLRDATALVSGVVAANTLRLQQVMQQQSEKLQHAVTTVSAAVLGPALVFALFGANVRLPLEGSLLGLPLMLMLALLSAGLIRLLLSRMTD